MANWEDHMQWSHAGMYTDEYFHKVIEALCSTGCRKKRGQKKKGGGRSWGKFSNLFHKCIIQKGYTHLSFILVYLETRNRTNLHTAFLCFWGKSVTCRSPLKKPLFGKIIFFHFIFFIILIKNVEHKSSQVINILFFPSPSLLCQHLKHLSNSGFNHSILFTSP